VCCSCGGGGGGGWVVVGATVDDLAVAVGDVLYAVRRRRIRSSTLNDSNLIGPLEAFLFFRRLFAPRCLPIRSAKDISSVCPRSTCCPVTFQYKILESQCLKSEAPSAPILELYA
jgi:hypothetical protein